MNRKTLYFFLSAMLFPYLAYAEVQVYTVERVAHNAIIEKEVKESVSYSGLAAFYNGVTAYIVDESGIEKLDEGRSYTLEASQSLAIVGHYKILIVSNVGGAVSFIAGRLTWQESDNVNPELDSNKPNTQLLLKSDLAQLAQPFQKLKYAHLWEPFRFLCIGIERILLWLHAVHNFGWGATIILLSLLFKLFILPANILLIRSQRKLSYIRARLAPELEAIKANLSGEEAHEKFMDVHRAQGVTPFYTLRPLLLSLAPLPFMIAIFNVLGELDHIAGHSFLWIRDLAYPDAIFDFGMHLPLLGNSLNLLPILMTLLTIISAFLHRNKIVSAKDLHKQRRNLYFMAFGFFLLFYPFPSAMVLYWTFANIWPLIQQRFIHV